MQCRNWCVFTVDDFSENAAEHKIKHILVCLLDILWKHLDKFWHNLEGILDNIGCGNWVPSMVDATFILWIWMKKNLGTQRDILKSKVSVPFYPPGLSVGPCSSCIYYSKRGHCDNSKGKRSMRLCPEKPGEASRTPFLLESHRTCLIPQHRIVTTYLKYCPPGRVLR